MALKKYLKWLLCISLVAQAPVAWSELADDSPSPISETKIPISRHASLCAEKLLGGEPIDKSSVYELYQVNPEHFQDVINSLLLHTNLFNSIWYQNMVFSLMDSYLEVPYIEPMIDIYIDRHRKNNELPPDYFKDREYRKNLKKGISQFRAILSENDEAKWKFVTDLTDKILDMYFYEPAELQWIPHTKLFFKLETLLGIKFDPFTSKIGNTDREEHKKEMQRLIGSIRGEKAHYEILRFAVAHSLDPLLLAIENNLGKRMSSFWGIRTNPLKVFGVAWMATAGTIFSTFDFSAYSNPLMGLVSTATVFIVAALATGAGAGLSGLFLPFRSGEKNRYVDGRKTGIGMIGGASEHGHPVIDDEMIERGFLRAAKIKYNSQGLSAKKYSDFTRKLVEAIGSGLLLQNSLVLPVAAAEGKTLGVIDGHYPTVKAVDMETLHQTLLEESTDIFEKSQTSVSVENLVEFDEAFKKLLLYSSAEASYFIKYQQSLSDILNSPNGLADFEKLVDGKRDASNFSFKEFFAVLEKSKKVILGTSEKMAESYDVLRSVVQSTESQLKDLPSSIESQEGSAVQQLKVDQYKQARENLQRQLKVLKSILDNYSEIVGENSQKRSNLVNKWMYAFDQIHILVAGTLQESDAFSDKDNIAVLKGLIGYLKALE